MQKHLDSTAPAWTQKQLFIPAKTEDGVCVSTTPQKHKKNPMWCHTTSLFLWIHVSSFTTCSAAPPPPSHYPPLSTHLNPIQPNSGIQPCSPPQLLLSFPPAGRLGHTTPAFLPPPLLAPHTLCILPSFAIMCSPSTLLFPLTHTLSPVLPLLSVPWQCNPIPVGPEPGA